MVEISEVVLYYLVADALEPGHGPRVEGDPEAGEEDLGGLGVSVVGELLIVQVHVVHVE